MRELNGPFGKQLLEITSGSINVNDVEMVVKTVKKVSDNQGVVSQIFDAERIAGREHLIHAIRLALIHLESGESFADSPDIELACWTAGTRQIDQALELSGIRGETKKAALVVVGSNKKEVKKATEELSQKLQIERDESVLDITPEKTELLKEVFSISNAQLATAGLKELILERIALLSLEK